MRILITLCFVILFCSCEKKKYCYSCKTDTYVSPNPTNQPYMRSERELCDLTEKDKKEFEQSNTNSSTLRGTTYTSVTTCTLK